MFPLGTTADSLVSAPPVIALASSASVLKIILKGVCRAVTN
jgi:hypothetical protein